MFTIAELRTPDAQAPAAPPTYARLAARKSLGHTGGVKTAISLPDELFATADAYARRVRMTRSELYARALAEFLDRNDDDAVTAGLNRVCMEVDSSLEAGFAQASRRILGHAEW